MLDKDMPGHVLEHRSSGAGAGRFVCSHHPSSALSGDKGYVYFRLPPGALMFVRDERYLFVGHCFCAYASTKLCLYSVTCFNSH